MVHITMVRVTLLKMLHYSPSRFAFLVAVNLIAQVLRSRTDKHSAQGLINIVYVVSVAA